MAVIYGLSLVVAFLLAFGLNAVIELVHKECVDGELVYGSFHTFKHGALHGALLGLMMAIPPLVSCALFERRSLKNIGLNCLYWLITCALMGGLLDAW